MPSQYGEHEFILRHFQGRAGRFLDVGAYDGLTFSNTRCLMDLGWSGVCVEPNPMVFPYLMENTQAFPSVDLVQAAIVPDAGLKRFWATQDLLSTCDRAHKDKVQAHNPAVPYREVWVNGITWSQFLAAFPGEANFINIDVEGLNLEALRGLPFYKLKPEMVCVELDPIKSKAEMTQWLMAVGLMNSIVVGGNLLAWK